MIYIKKEKQIGKMRKSGKVLAKVFKRLSEIIVPGISTLDIDKIVEEIILSEKMEPTFKGYSGFPASACISINDESIHGIPSADRILNEGDIVSVDIGATYEGYCTDAARTYPVGQISDLNKRLIQSAEDSFFEGIKFAKNGYRIGDISSAIQKKAESDGFSVIRQMTGHGVGKNLHEDPAIPNYGIQGRGPKILPGMTFAIEPMLTAGGFEVETLLDDWTVVTIDGSMASHYENTVLITDNEPEILTI